MDFDMVNRTVILHNEDDKDRLQIPFPKGILPLMTTDEQAMWRVRTHQDESAFALLVGRWREVIWRLCLRMVGDVHRAEDITQEVFLRLFLRRDTYRVEAKFSTYLWRVAINLCRDELRRVTRRRESALENADHAEAGQADESIPATTIGRPDCQMQANEQAALVREAMAQLPEPYRLVLVLRHYENLKFREIAEVLEIPEGTVKSRMAEALSRLAGLLSILAPETSSASKNSLPKRESAAARESGLNAQ